MEKLKEILNNKTAQIISVLAGTAFVAFMIYKKRSQGTGEKPKRIIKKPKKVIEVVNE